MRNAYKAIVTGKKPRKNSCFRYFALFCLFLQPSAFVLSAHAAISQTINYQGFLLSKITNLPLEMPQDIKFVIHAVATGESPLFTESRCNVGVNKGRYDVEIGSVSGGIPASVFQNNQNLWLEIQVDGDGDCAGSYEAMSPRIRLQASPYAFNSLYASTASAATTVFAADTIGSLPQTTNGAITISTNLFVMGGISVGNISPGQKLAVAGIVESSTGGFKFPDGSVQIKAAGETMWEVQGPNLFTLNSGNIGIGEHLDYPLARLHVSSAAGDTGDLLLVSTGSFHYPLFRVNGLAEVYGGAYYGDGTTLTGILRKAGDTMTGPLTVTSTMTVAGSITVSSLSVTSPLGLNSPKIRLWDNNVAISSETSKTLGAGVRISSNVYIVGFSSATKYYGDGSALTRVISLDSSKVRLTGDTMTGPLQTTTLTVTGSAFSVGGTAFSVQDGNAAVGSPSYLAALTVGGGIIAASSITAQGDLYADAVISTSANFWAGLTASSGTFLGYSGPDDANSYSITAASGIKVNSGAVAAPSFIGNGSQLTGVTGTDSTRVLKTGDSMTGSLTILNSSITVIPGDQDSYGLMVRNPADYDYHLVVTTGGNVGVQVTNPTAPLEVNSQVLISNSVSGPTQLHLKANEGQSYIRWSDPGWNPGSPNLGALGYPYGGRDLVYRAMGSDASTGGAEVFRIKSDNSANWQFIIGSPVAGQPSEKFLVMTNMLVSTSAANPILYVSTTAGKVSVNTTAQTHALTVNGGINAVSSITAQGGFYGDGSGLNRLSAGSLPQVLAVGSITAISGGAYDGVVFSTTVYASSRLAVGTDEFNQPFNPSSALHVRGTTRLGTKGAEDVLLYFYPRDDFPAAAYIRWYDASYGAKGVLGVANNSRDLVYRGGATSMSDGVEAFRIKPNGSYIMGSSDKDFTPAERFHVLNNMIVSAPGSNAVLFVSTGFGTVGISTGTPKEGLHVASSFLVGDDRPSAALYVSTQSGYTGIGTGTPQAKLDVNGLGVFRSSLTVTGTGLSGTQSALEVIGSTLVVRNDGTVGIGVAAPMERLDVAGKVKATGFVAARLITTNTCNLAATCTATCTGLRYVMGGGCFNTGTDSLFATYPVTGTAWKCDYSDATGNITAYAICSTVE